MWTLKNNWLNSPKTRKRGIELFELTSKRGLSLATSNVLSQYTNTSNGTENTSNGVTPVVITDVVNPVTTDSLTGIPLRLYLLKGINSIPSGHTKSSSFLNLLNSYPSYYFNLDDSTTNVLSNSFLSSSVVTTFQLQIPVRRNSKYTFNLSQYNIEGLVLSSIIKVESLGKTYKSDNPLLVTDLANDTFSVTASDTCGLITGNLLTVTATINPSTTSYISYEAILFDISSENLSTVESLTYQGKTFINNGSTITSGSLFFNRYSGKLLCLL